MDITTWILLSAVCYRIGAFIQLDSLWADLRVSVNNWLTKRGTWWGWKLHEAIFTCPWCLTIWVSAAVVTFWGVVLVPWPGWWFPIHWLAVATGGVLFWRGIDDRDRE